MPKEVSSFLKSIPNFDLRKDPGGFAYGELKKENMIGWETLTSREGVNYYLTDLGLIVDACGIGVVATYNQESVLNIVHFEVVPFLDGLLNDRNASDVELQKLFDLRNRIKESEGGEDLAIGIDLNNLDSSPSMHFEVETSTDLFGKTIKNSKSEVIVKININDGEEIILYFLKREDVLLIGVSCDGDAPISPYGSIFGSEEDGGDEPLFIASRSVSLDCNYMTYLDGKNPNRFDKLAKRIFVDQLVG